MISATAVVYIVDVSDISTCAYAPEGESQQINRYETEIRRYDNKDKKGRLRRHEGTTAEIRRCDKEDTKNNVHTKVRQRKYEGTTMKMRRYDN